MSIPNRLKYLVGGKRYMRYIVFFLRSLKNSNREIHARPRVALGAASIRKVFT